MVGNDISKVVSQYRMKYDLHTHSIYSRRYHAKGTIEENVLQARKKGLDALAISDHGLGHLFYGIKRKDIQKIREEIERLKDKYLDINIYMSVESNIIDSENGLDMTAEDIKKFDFIIGGYHFGVRNGNCFENYISNKRKKFSGSLIARNTEMTLRAIYENSLTVLTHPGEKYKIDLKEVAKACASKKTLMEISNWHENLSEKQIREVMNENVEFVISSDAHRPENIGSFELGLARALNAGLEISRIVNIEKKSNS